MEIFLKKKWFAVVGAILCTLLWGSAYPMIKYGYMTLQIDTTAEKLIFAGIRFLIAGAMVFLAAWVKEKRLPTVPRPLVGGAVLYGVLQTGLMYILNYIGVAHTTATKTAILTAGSAFFAVLFAPLFFREERLTALKLIGAAVGLAGIAVVNLGDLSGGFTLTGEGFVLLATLLNTAGSFVGKRISRGRVFTMTAYQLMIGAALILAVGLLMGGTFVMSLQGIGITLYLAFVSAAAFSLWTALLVHHEAGRILVFNLLIPIFGAMWSYLILGEKNILDPMYLLSVALICIGIFSVNYHKNPRSISS